jgi:leucyl-tRNA synthetase
MGVPAHDERDFEFATKYQLPINRVIKGKDGFLNDGLPFVEYGVMVNSNKFDGLTTEEGKIAVIKELEKHKMGELKTNYRLRDWLVSRQRYWGAPIPVVYCPEHGEVIVPDDQLPVELPYDVNFTPDGTSPLAKHEGFINTTCPICGKPSKRDADTLDTFVCSSWYFLRYPDSKNDKEAFNKKVIDKMLPVDKYIGGAEHACMHLLYARFFTKALRDMGHLNFGEPFASLVHQGTILGTDGNKMSKSKGNVISPDSYIALYGSDVFRLYLGFGFKYIEGGAWNDDGIKAIAKWVERVERTALKSFDVSHGNFGEKEKELNCVLHNTVKSVGADYEAFSFNTAIARMMELVNALNKYDAENADSGVLNAVFYKEVCRDLVIMLSPLAPHICEELWQRMGFEYSVFNRKFPMFDEDALVRDVVELAVQVNSKIRSRILVPSGATNDEITAAVKRDEKITALLEGKEIKKVIVIPGRLVNIII